MQAEAARQAEADMIVQATLRKETEDAATQAGTAIVVSPQRVTVPRHLVPSGRQAPQAQSAACVIDLTADSPDPFVIPSFQEAVARERTAGGQGPLNLSLQQPLASNAALAPLDLNAVPPKPTEQTAENEAGNFSKWSILNFIRYPFI